MPRVNRLGPVQFYSLQLPLALKNRLAGYAKAVGCPESEVVREALDTYLVLVTRPLLGPEELEQDQRCLA